MATPLAAIPSASGCGGGTANWRRLSEPSYEDSLQIATSLRSAPLYRKMRGWGRQEGVPGALPPQGWPAISKSDIRTGFPHNFLNPGTDLEALVEQEKVEFESTSGTSGDPMPILLPRGWWEWQEGRALRLNRAVAAILDRKPRSRRAVLATPACNHAISYHQSPTRAQRTVGDSLFLALSRHPFLWSEAELDRMVGETIDWNPVFLDVDPVFGVCLALHCQRRAVKLPALQFILSSYEYLSVVHRRTLEQAFGVPVCNLYGSTETGHLLMEDERGVLRPNTEVALLETCHAERADVGELVVSTLTNEYMPLVRYAMGDLVAPPRAPDSGPILHGRIADSVRTGDGRWVTVREIDECFAGEDGFAHYELRQGDTGSWDLRHAHGANPPSPGSQRRVLDRLEELLGERLRGLHVDAFQPAPSGKYRLVIPKPWASRGYPDAALGIKTRDW